MGSGRLDRDARDARRDAREDFPGDGSGGFGVVEGGDASSLPCVPSKDDFVAVLDAGNLRDVKNNLIHADAADKRARAGREPETETIAERAGEAVAVTGRDERDAHGLGGDESCVVADGRAGWNRADADDRGLPGEDGLERGAGGGERGRFRRRGRRRDRSAGRDRRARGRDEAWPSCRDARRGRR